MYYMYRNFARTSDSRCLRCNLHRHFSLKRLGEGLSGEGRRDEYYATAHHRRRLRDLRWSAIPGLSESFSNRFFVRSLTLLLSIIILSCHRRLRPPTAWRFAARMVIIKKGLNPIRPNAWPKSIIYKRTHDSTCKYVHYTQILGIGYEYTRMYTYRHYNHIIYYYIVTFDFTSSVMAVFISPRNVHLPRSVGFIWEYHKPIRIHSSSYNIISVPP